MAMVKGCERQRWWHTAGLMAVIANCNRNHEKHPRPYTAKEFHPDFARQAKAGTPIDKSTMGIVIGAFVPPERQRQSEIKAKAKQDMAAQLVQQQRQRLRIVA